MKIHYEIIEDAELKTVAGGLFGVWDFPGNSAHGMAMSGHDEEKDLPNCVPFQLSTGG